MTDFRARAASLGLTKAPKLHARAVVVEIDGLQAEKVTDERRPLTTARAVAYLDLPIFPGERDVSDHHCQKLLDEMVRGRFNWDLVTIATCELDGKTYKINGQHTCWAALGLDDSNSPQVRFVHYRVASQEQMKALYGSFDRGKVRSDAHLSRVELLDTPAHDGLWKNTHAKMVPAFKFWRFPKREEFVRVTAAELSAVIHENAEVYNAVGRFVQSLDNAGLAMVRKRSVMAAMLETFFKTSTYARDFWRNTIDGVGLQKDDARWHLRRLLGSVAVHRSLSNTAKRVIDEEELYRYCIAAWNRWRQNEKVDMLRPTQKRVRAVELRPRRRPAMDRYKLQHRYQDSGWEELHSARAFPSYRNLCAAAQTAALLARDAICYGMVRVWDCCEGRPVITFPAGGGLPELDVPWYSDQAYELGYRGPHELTRRERRGAATAEALETHAETPAHLAGEDAGPEKGRPWWYTLWVRLRDAIEARAR